MMDCLVSYLSPEEGAGGVPRRYYCYHVVAGPGASPGASVAVITTLAAHNADGLCDTCDHLHAAPEGGPAAAIARALHYLDAFHQEDRLRRVQTEVRGARAGIQ
jgi:hypothetical protein